MPSEIVKHGDGFYAIERVNARGHTTPSGQMLAAPDVITLPFRRAIDPPGVNLDPLDVISALVMHLEPINAKAADYLAKAAEALSGRAPQVEAVATVAPVVSAPTVDGPRRPGRPKKNAEPPSAGIARVVTGGDDEEGGEE